MALRSASRDGLSMATTIHDAGLKTHIPADGECFSACAYMFFAGVERGSEGKLGVITRQARVGATSESSA